MTTASLGTTGFGSGARSTIDIKMPKFKGDITQFEEWSNAFQALVHETNKSPVEKMGLLKASLEDEARLLIAGYGNTCEHYLEALRVLGEVYGDPVLLVEAQQREIENLPNRYAERLPNQNRLVGLSRWLLERVKKLRRFNQNLACGSGAKDSALSLSRSNTNAASTSLCSNCQGGHRAVDCCLFKGLPLSEKMTLVMSKNLCFGCLRQGHSLAKCRSKQRCGADDCSRHHHALIHKAGEREPKSEFGGRASTNSSSTGMSVVLGMVPVVCFGPNGRVVLNALIDEGSDTTFIMDSALKKIGHTRGKEGRLVVNGATGSTEFRSRMVDVEVSGAGGGKFQIRARSHPNVCQGLRGSSWEMVKGRWNHLRNLDLSTNEDRVQMLVGLDNGHLIEPLEFRHGSPGDPYAFRTHLGWVCRGSMEDGLQLDKKMVHFAHVADHDSEITRLDECLHEFFETESYGAERRENQPCHSMQDQYALEMIQGGIGKLENSPGYEASLPWAPGLEKPARFHGRSLNDSLLTGPSLQCELLDVLLRFREREVAVTADIEAMFSRISLRKEDARYHRFLWRDSPDRNLQTLQMTGVVFGDSPSPCIAISTLHRAAVDANCSKEVERTIKTQFYVDDFLDSFGDERQAINVASKVKEVLGKANFNLRGWTSNKQGVVGAVGAVNMGHVPLHQNDTRILRSTWNTIQDCITFSTTTVSKISFTRRGLLSKLAGLFDPQGLIAPVTVSGKIKMKELVIQNLGWDDPVSEETRHWWSDWVSGLQDLSAIMFPRCLFPLGLEHTHRELHIFCDASEQAFAAVAYLRSQDDEGNVAVRLAYSKTRVSSKRPKTIPKLELQGAVLGARLAKYLIQTLRIKIHSTTYWTDSQVVHAWITNLAQTYKPFVAVRVGEIQTLTKGTEWRHVPGAGNPADLATRASQRPTLPGLWLSGPPFLLRGVDCWPERKKIEETTEEVRAKFAQTHAVEGPQVGSGAKTLHGAVEEFRVDQPNGTLEEMIVLAQLQMFPEELRALNGGRALSKSSRLLELSPFLDPEGLLRARGRLSQAQVGYDQKFPVVLHPTHPLTKLIVQDNQHRHHHPGVNHGLGLLRQEYWVLRGREAVKTARRECDHCQRMTAHPATQEMADLPQEQLACDQPPFYFASVDFFGPMEVLVSRNKIEKRWGSIFTCMTTRAVDIEAAPSLSTPDFLNVLRNLVSLRGKPHQIYSDNGTNFVGAANLLAELQRKEGPGPTFLDSNKIVWKFQPPGAPHWGGVH
ncbi:uncharacterized protein LOC131890693 [Tigriopus californicus]|uniref:uncharacterized protein LOC131890693 n=1 Tax=Tigriopus californicus TaxID=6832 RepID=UPI0027D9E547|nr:uncharacterized protein LOC131890693 [Tigriopus californicus]